MKDRNLRGILTFAGLGLVLGGVATGSAFAEAPDLEKIILDSDRARGGSIEGISWNVAVRQFKGAEQESEIEVHVKASCPGEHLYALVSFVGPARYKGRKMLLRDHNMWFMKRGLRKPVPISTRQRLSGSAANADIASANYTYDYKPELLRKEKIGDDEFYVLKLTARSSLVTYPEIEYWVSVNDHLGRRAKFKVASGKILKEATFEYENVLELDGGQRPFVSKVTIVDQLAANERTELELTGLVRESHRRSTFLVQSL